MQKIKVKPEWNSWGDQISLGPFFSWQDHHVGQYEIGFDLFRWIARLVISIRGIKEEEQVHRKPKHDFGTRLVKDIGAFHYARAGEDLKERGLVEADIAGRIAPPPGENTLQVTSELVYGNVKGAPSPDRYGLNILGWPLVNVKKGRCFWIQEPPIGGEFVKEGE